MTTFESFGFVDLTLDLEGYRSWQNSFAGSNRRKSPLFSGFGGFGSVFQLGDNLLLLIDGSLLSRDRLGLLLGS